MSNDQLTRNERVRLEALARTQGMVPINPENWPLMKKQAEEVEAWLKASDLNAQN